MVTASPSAIRDRHTHIREVRLGKVDRGGNEEVLVAAELHIVVEGVDAKRTLPAPLLQSLQVDFEWLGLVFVLPAALSQIRVTARLLHTAIHALDVNAAGFVILERVILLRFSFLAIFFFAFFFGFFLVFVLLRDLQVPGTLHQDRIEHAGR